MERCLVGWNTAAVDDIRASLKRHYLIHSLDLEGDEEEGVQVEVGARSGKKRDVRCKGICSNEETDNFEEWQHKQHWSR